MARARTAKQRAASRRNLEKARAAKSRGRTRNKAAKRSRRVFKAVSAALSYDFITTAKRVGWKGYKGPK